MSSFIQEFKLKRSKSRIRRLSMDVSDQKIELKDAIKTEKRLRRTGGTASRGFTISTAKNVKDIISSDKIQLKRLQQKLKKEKMKQRRLRQSKRKPRAKKRQRAFGQAGFLSLGVGFRERRVR